MGVGYKTIILLLYQAYSDRSEKTLNLNGHFQLEESFAEILLPA
jgi:hypothetical protein